MDHTTIVPIYLISIFLFIITLNITLIISIKPTFIISTIKISENNMKRIELLSYLTLLILSIWLGSITIVLKQYHRLLDFY